MIIKLNITGSLANCAIGNNRQLVIRLLVGAWCLTCFVLITAYSSVLISFLTAPDTYKPIINSINELPKKPFIRVTVDKGFFPDYLFQVKKKIFISMDQNLIKCIAISLLLRVLEFH